MEAVYEALLFLSILSILWLQECSTKGRGEG